MSKSFTVKAPLEQVFRSALTDKVLVTLRKAIVAVTFAPSDDVPETRSVEQLGVSRVPVREGLMEFDKHDAGSKLDCDRRWNRCPQTLGRVTSPDTKGTDVSDSSRVNKGLGPHGLFPSLIT